MALSCEEGTDVIALNTNGIVADEDGRDILAADDTVTAVSFEDNPGITADDGDDCLGTAEVLDLLAVGDEEAGEKVP